MAEKGWRPSLPPEAREHFEQQEAETDDLLSTLGATHAMRDIAALRYRNRKGEGITFADWIEAFADQEYRRVAEDTIDGVWISTVWLGLDHGYNPEHPLIFETMCFDHSGQGRSFDYQDRHSTEEQALKGHAEAVAAVNAELIRPHDEEANEADE